MAVSAHDVARALRERLPGLNKIQLQKLLYYCQGHHLAATGRPLFNESISAWDNGPVVGQLWYVEEHDEPRPAPLDLSEGQLNTVGYVCSRYGGLTANDLINMTHGEPPWKLADQNRAPGGRERINPAIMREFFSTDGAAGAGDEDAGDRPPVATDAVRELLRGAQKRAAQSARPDSVDRILHRIRQLSA